MPDHTIDCPPNTYDRIFSGHQSFLCLKLYGEYRVSQCVEIRKVNKETDKEDCFQSFLKRISWVETHLSFLPEGEGWVILGFEGLPRGIKIENDAEYKYFVGQRRLWLEAMADFESALKRVIRPRHGLIQSHVGDLELAIKNYEQDNT